MSQAEMSIAARFAAVENRLSKLEEFLPILGEAFAGKIGGTSEDASAIFEAVGNADATAFGDALKNAIAIQAAEQSDG